MRKRSSRNRKFIKSVVAFTLSTSCLLGSIGLESNVSKAISPAKTETMLANLTQEQRSALSQLQSNQASGLQISTDINLHSSEETSVIVEFVNKPVKIAKIEASLRGDTLSDTEAMKLVEEDHSTFTQDVEVLLVDDKNKKVDYKVTHTFKKAFNGVSLSLPANQIKNLLKSKSVKTVWSNHTFSIDPPKENNQVNANKEKINYMPYDGLDRLHAEGYTGKGIKVGILDTGIDYNHPDLKDAYRGGYDFVDNDSDPMETTYAEWKNSGKAELIGSTSYYTNHGTHVAGIIGGRGKADSEFKMIGAAPESNIYSYRVLGPYGSGTTGAIIAGIEKALTDGMDVINMSLGAAINDPLYATSIAVNNAVLSGVTTVVAAGNTGDKNFTLGSPGAAALALTVGASSISLDVYQYASVQNGVNYNVRQLARNYSDDLTQLKGKTFELVDVGLARTASEFDGKDLNGKYAFIKRGTNALADKIKNAKARGAVGVLMYNDELNEAEGAIQSFLGESVDAVPTFSVSNSEGKTILAAIQAGNSDFTFGDYSKIQTAHDELAGFSSRGPSRFNYDIKPEVTAPGVSIMSTVPYYMNNKDGDGTDRDDYKYAYQRASGTSMAAPFVAGVSALLLQSNKDLEPADIKSILMNTADPLSKAYSVFEIGSGRIDAYEAIHSDVEIQVDDRTSTILHNKEKSVRELTGGMSFGSYGITGQDISEDRKIVMKNRSNVPKSFDVKVDFQTGLKGSKDAAKNNVSLNGPSSIDIEGNGQKVVKFELNIPKTAEKGKYEGYLVYTNKKDPNEVYQIPFGVGVVEEGIDTLSLQTQMYSGDTSIPAQSIPYIGFKFSLKSHMKTVDVIVQDGITGEDVGYLGQLDGRLIDENVEITILNGFNGSYFPFTDDPKNPISHSIQLAKTGFYKLKVIGTNHEGKTFTKTADFMYEKGAPIMSSSFDSLDQKVIEYKDHQFDADGTYLYDFTINVKDPETDLAKQLGISVDQTHNKVVSQYDSPYFAEPINTDKDGNYNDQILVRKRNTPLKVQFYGMDASRNFTSDLTSMLRVVFVPEKLPYYYLKADKKTASTGDTINYSVRAHNMKHLKTAKIKIPILIQDGREYAKVKNVVVSDAVKQYGDAQVSVANTNDGIYSEYTITFNYLGNEPLPEDLQLVNFELETTKMYMKSFPINWFTMEYTSSSINQSNVETKDVYAYADVVPLKPTYSKLEGALKLEGTIDPLTNQTNWALDQKKIGAKVTVTSHEGKEIPAVLTSKDGRYVALGLIPDSKPYTIKVDAPGHFTRYKSIVLSDLVREEQLGKRVGYTLAQAAAGDTNKDHVIDILDALAIKQNWGKYSSNTDLNFDGVVDKEDMKYVIKNYGLQNDSVEDAPKAKNSYKGITLDDVLSELDIK